MNRRRDRYVTMPEREVRIFNVVNHYAMGKGFRLTDIPKLDPSLELGHFTFTDGKENRTAVLFDLMSVAKSRKLSENNMRGIDDALKRYESP
jgi:hypothetical protein